MKALEDAHSFLHQRFFLFRPSTCFSHVCSLPCYLLAIAAALLGTDIMNIYKVLPWEVARYSIHVASEIYQTMSWAEWEFNETQI